jgi:hypothetical protein
MLGRLTGERRPGRVAQYRAELQECVQQSLALTRRSPASWLDHGPGMPRICQLGRSAVRLWRGPSSMPVGDDAFASINDDLRFTPREIPDPLIGISSIRSREARMPGSVISTSLKPPSARSGRIPQGRSARPGRGSRGACHARPSLSA